MFDPRDPRGPGEYDVMRQRANDARDAAQRVTTGRHGNEASLLGTSEGRWWAGRRALFLVSLAVAALVLAGVLLLS